MEHRLTLQTQLRYCPFLSLVIRLERRTSKENSSRRIMRLVPVFILETYNQTNYKYWPKFVQTDNALSSINKYGHCVKEFITAVCVLFLIKLRWPKKKSVYDLEFAKLNSQGWLVSELFCSQSCWRHLEYHWRDSIQKIQPPKRWKSWKGDYALHGKTYIFYAQALRKCHSK